jgi:hypothetical protein
MSFIGPPVSAADVLQMFRRDIPNLLLGATYLVAVEKFLCSFGGQL